LRATGTPLTFRGEKHSQKNRFVITYHARFQFDSRKSENNRLKHGVDFSEAQAMWEDPDRVEIPEKAPA
jgi:hypothetical protein